MGVYKRDSKGLDQILNSAQVAQAVHGLAASVAGNIDPSLDVVVDDYTTDRAASSVTVREADAKLRQIRDGELTRAAAAAGLEVRERG